MKAAKQEENFFDAGEGEGLQGWEEGVASEGVELSVHEEDFFAVEFMTYCHSGGYPLLKDCVLGFLGLWVGGVESHAGYGL